MRYSFRRLLIKRRVDARTGTQAHQLGQLAHNVLFNGDRRAKLLATTKAADDLEQLEIGKVVEAQRRVGVEAPREARILVAQHLEHLRFVAGHDHRNVLARRTRHLREEC